MKQLTTLLLLLFPILFNAQDFTITNFKVNLEINSDGSFEVEETIDVFFHQKRRGIIREIDNEYKVNGNTLFLDITNINIQDHEYKVDSRKEKVSIRIGNPDIYITGDQQYRISYRIKNGIIDYPEHQEFHYDITGNRWDAKIEQVDFTIILPRSITFGVDDIKVTGGRENQNLEVAEIKQVDSRTIKGNSTTSLKRHNGITAAIRLPKRYLEVTNNQTTFYKSAQDSPEKNPDKPWFIALPLALFGLFVSYWRKLRQINFVADEDEIRIYPPEGLTSAHVGGFIDQSSNTRDIVSLLPYWAGEGYIKMKQIGDDIYLYRMKNLPPEFPEYEHIIFERLFSDSEVSKIADLKTKFYTSLQSAQSLLTSEIKAQDYYDPKYSKIFRGPLMALFPITMIALGIFSLIYFKLIALGIGFIVFGIIGLFLSFFKLPFTKKGARLKSEIDSFKRFLEDPDEKVLESVLKEDPNYFDKMFPFAVAFGLEKIFLKRLEPYMHVAPYWYRGENDNISFTSFSNSFKPEVIQSAFSSTPHTSSGGSSGGGFSSGSGVGGGGGSSW